MVEFEKKSVHLEINHPERKITVIFLTWRGAGKEVVKGSVCLLEGLLQFVRSLFVLLQTEMQRKDFNKSCL